MITPFNRDRAQKREQGSKKPGAEKVFPGGEIHEGERGVKNVLRKIGGDANQKRIVHGGMVRNEKHPITAPRNVIPSPHTGEIQRETEKQEADKAGARHGNVGCPDPQAREYFSNQHEIYSPASGDHIRGCAKHHFKAANKLPTDR
jgi:hypothetical protein